jgi:hypothetical protein
MQSKAKAVDEYIQSLPEDRKKIINEIRKVILINLPKGFSEGVAYGMIGYCVPLSMYSKGYHCDPGTPLPFMAVASQKNFVALYHMGIYGDPKLLKWFKDEYVKACKTKLDMGKSCIRLKKIDDIPYKLIGELCSKITPAQWIEFYENARETYSTSKSS